MIYKNIKCGQILRYGLNFLNDDKYDRHGFAIIIPTWFVPRTCMFDYNMMIGDGVLTIGIRYIKELGWDFAKWYSWTTQITSYGKDTLTFKERLNDIHTAD